MLKARNGRLEWTQVLRSNDLFRGVPYNFVQFTVVQEVMAGWLGLEVGSYDHLSDSLHVYEDDFGLLKGSDGRMEIAPNTDSLRLPKEESDEAFAALEKRLDVMTDDCLTQGRMRELLKGNGLPEAFENLLRIAAADSARRRGWIGLSGAAARGCTNGALLQVWEGWSARIGPP
jgi:thymidylate synthase